MKEKKKSQRKRPKYIRDAEKAHDAKVYSEGFRHGYEMGLNQDKDLKRIN